MLKREITYTFRNNDDEDEQETDIFWFHLYEDEIAEWNAKYKEGLGDTVKRMLREDDNEGLLAFYKKLILDAYGVREEGGRVFNKTDELRARFSRHAAYKALWVECAQDEKAAADFFNGIFPQQMLDQDKPKPGAKVVDVKSKEKSV